MKAVLSGAAVALAAVVVASSGAVSASVSESDPAVKLPAGLTAAGRMRWSFEALLDEEFPQRGVFVWVPRERSEYNFFCTRACVPHARYRAFIYLFDHPRGTDTGFGGRLHVSRKTLRGEIFGNFPIPIRIKGHAVACDKRETRFLVTYADSVSFGLNCLRRPQR